MAMIDDVGRTISDTGKEIAKKAREFTEVIQLKSQISSEKAKAAQAYAEIGKAYYEEHRYDPDDRFAEQCSAIRSSLEMTAMLEEKIHQLEGSRVCAECGARVGRDAMYCSRCGAPMNEDQF